MTDILANFHFLRPMWLLALLPGLLMAFFLWRQRRRGGTWHQVIDQNLLPYLIDTQQSGSKSAPLFLLLVTWLLASIALAGPTWTRLPQPTQQSSDALIILLDLSPSMNAADVEPSRIVRARRKLTDVLAARAEGMSALIAYAGDAHVVTPLTDDADTIIEMLPALDPDIMPVAGSNLLAAAALATELIANAQLPTARILLITDGVDGDRSADAARLLKGRGLRLDVLGVGTPQGAPVPLPNGGFVRDSNDSIVVARLDTSALQELAGSTDGRFRMMSIDDSDISALSEQPRLLSADSLRASQRQADTWRDEGGWLVLALLPFAAFAFRRGWLLCFLPLLLMPPTAEAGVWEDLWSRPDQQAARLLEQGDTEKAAELFKDKRWRAQAFAKSGAFSETVEQLNDLDTIEDHYNRGNALARAGELEQALSAYDQALEAQPDMEDALFNRKLVEDLLKQQQQQQQQENSEQNSDSEQNQDSNKDQNQQQQQDQSGKRGEDSDEENQPETGPDENEQPPDQSADEQQSDQDQSESSDQSQDGNEQDQSEQQSQQKAGEQNPEQQSEQARAEALEESNSEEKQREQAMQQWLRRIPDDPGGLLRRKFLYEHKKRLAEGEAGSINEDNL